MRPVVLFPVTAAVLVAAGCGSEGREQAVRSSLQRDLTLATQTSDVGIASPVELGRLRNQPPAPLDSRRIARRRSVRRSSAVDPRIVLATSTKATPTAVLAVPSPAVQPASTASEPVNDRELPPGKTVTVIPASTGRSTDGGSTGDFPMAGTGGSGMGGGGSGMGGGGSGMGGGGSGMGGGCPGHGRGPDIGIAGVPRPDFRIR